MNNTRSVWSHCVMAGVLWSLCLGASAGTNNYALIQKAVSSCEAPLPVYDSQLRKRPRGIINESSTSIFISCGMPADVFGDVWRVDLEFTNRSSSSATVSCTLVTGSPSGFLTSYHKQLFLPGSGGTTWMMFDKLIDNNDQYFDDQQAVSCLLPPQVEINSTGVLYVRNTN